MPWLPIEFNAGGKLTDDDGEEVGIIHSWRIDSTLNSTEMSIDLYITNPGKLQEMNRRALGIDK